MLVRQFAQVSGGNPYAGVSHGIVSQVKILAWIASSRVGQGACIREDLC
jgi:hypothetical protein